MFSSPRKPFCFKEPRTPLGFCDGPSDERKTSFTSNCRTNGYQQPYEAENEFHKAVCTGKLEVASCLLVKGDFHVNDEDIRKRTALHFACFHRHLDLVYFLLFSEGKINVLDDENCTPLMKAVQSLDTEIVSVLLGKGADPSIKDCNGQTAIHLAVYGDSLEIVSRLLEFGANIEETTEDGVTPLMLALQERKLLIAEYLIKQGANIHVRDDHERTTLMYGVKWDCPHIVELLLKRGLDHMLRDEFRWTAVLYAIVGKRKVRHRLVFLHWESLLSRTHRTFLENQPKDIFSPGHHFNSDSPISMCSRTEDRVNFGPQQDIHETILQNGTDEFPTMPSKKYENTEAQEVWDEKCLHPELRDYSHQISKPETEPQQSQPVWAYKCLHPELRDYVHQISIPKTEPEQLQGDTDFSEELYTEVQEYEMEKEESLDKIEENQEFSASDPNGLQEASTDTPQSSNMGINGVQEASTDTPQSSNMDIDGLQEASTASPQSSNMCIDGQHDGSTDTPQSSNMNIDGQQDASTDTPQSSNMDKDGQQDASTVTPQSSNMGIDAQHDASTDNPQSSNMDIDEEINVLRHLEKKSVMEDQKQTSEEEQIQGSGRKKKRTFIHAIRACFCSCFTKKLSSSPHHKK